MCHRLLTRPIYARGSAVHPERGRLGIRATLLNPVPSEQGSHVMRVRLGDFVAEQEVTLLLATEFDARAQGKSASVQCRVPDRDGVFVSQPLQVDWRAVFPEADHQQPVNRDVLLEGARMVAEGARARKRWRQTVAAGSMKRRERRSGQPPQSGASDPRRGDSGSRGIGPARGACVHAAHGGK